MNAIRPPAHLLYLILPAVLCLLQGCDGVSGPTASEPLVIQFDFQAPVQASVAQKVKFLDALEKYSAPEGSKILAEGHQIYPFLPQGDETATLKTESVVSAADNGEAGTSSTARTRNAANPAAIANTRTSNNPGSVVNTRTSNNPGGRINNTRSMHFVNNTRRQEFIASAAKTRSSQYIAFKNQQDMKAFLRVIESR